MLKVNLLNVGNKQTFLSYRLWSCKTKQDSKDLNPRLLTNTPQTLNSTNVLAILTSSNAPKTLKCTNAPKIVILLFNAPKIPEMTMNTVYDGI